MGDKPGHPFRGNQFTVGTSRIDGDYVSAERHHGSHPTLESAQKQARALAAQMGEGYEAVVYGDKIPGSQMLEIHDRVKGGSAPNPIQAKQLERAKRVAEQEKARQDRLQKESDYLMSAAKLAKESGVEWSERDKERMASAMRSAPQDKAQTDLDAYKKIGKDGKRDYVKNPLSEGEKKTLEQIHKTTPRDNSDPMKFGGVGAWSASLLEADRMAEPRRREEAARERRAAEGYITGYPKEGERLLTPDGKVFTAGRTVSSRFGSLVTDAADPKRAYAVGDLRTVTSGPDFGKLAAENKIPADISPMTKAIAEYTESPENKVRAARGLPPANPTRRLGQANPAVAGAKLDAEKAKLNREAQSRNLVPARRLTAKEKAKIERDVKDYAERPRRNLTRWRD